MLSILNHELYNNCKCIKLINYAVNYLNSLLYVALFTIAISMVTFTGLSYIQPLSLK